MPELKPESQPQTEVSVKPKEPFIKIGNRTNLLILAISILLSITVVIGIAGALFKTKIAKEADVEPAIVNPKGTAAFKYYPKGQDAQGQTGPDFRDGSNGPLEVKMERKEDRIVLSWDPSVKVTTVKVFDLGKIYKLKDQVLIWQIANYNPERSTLEAESDQIGHISSPYTLGEIKGFFLIIGNQNLNLAQGTRYSIEITGINTEGLPTLGTYTFTY